MISSKQRLLIFSLLASATFYITGCMVGPDYKRPDVNMPASWSKNLNAAYPMNLARWWKTFNDPVLDDLITQAVNGSPTLKQAQARLRQARAQLGFTAADLWPTLNSSGSYQHIHGSGTTFPGGAVSTATGTTAAGQTSTAAPVVTGRNTGTTDLYRVGFDASWEIDIFGGIRRSVEAAKADVAAALEDKRDVLVSLCAEVAIDYTDLRSYQQRLAIARNNLKTQTQTLELTRKRRQFGAATDLDVARSQSQVSATAAQIPVLEISARQSIHQLALLLGKDPNALSWLLSSDMPMPAGAPEVPLGLPADLLRQRPDIRRSERQLAAATARVGVATADLYPQFTLSGSLGRQGDTLGALGHSGNEFWSFGPSGSLPIFDARKRRFNIEIRNALQEQSLWTYELSVLTALSEVEDALVAWQGEKDRQKDLNDAVTANRHAVELANQLFTFGRTDFLSVLDAQRSLFAAEDIAAQSRRNLAANLITLYKALGGGWQLNDPNNVSP